MVTFPVAVKFILLHLAHAQGLTPNVGGRRLSRLRKFRRRRKFAFLLVLPRGQVGVLHIVSIKCTAIQFRNPLRNLTSKLPHRQMACRTASVDRGALPPTAAAEGADNVLLAFSVIHTGAACPPRCGARRHAD